MKKILLFNEGAEFDALSLELEKFFYSNFFLPENVKVYIRSDFESETYKKAVFLIPKNYKVALYTDIFNTLKEYDIKVFIIFEDQDTKDNFLKEFESQPIYASTTLKEFNLNHSLFTDFVEYKEKFILKPIQKKLINGVELQIIEGKILENPLDKSFLKEWGFNIADFVDQSVAQDDYKCPIKKGAVAFNNIVINWLLLSLAIPLYNKECDIYVYNTNRINTQNEPAFYIGVSKSNLGEILTE